jgi:hypothetical protein
MKKNGYVKNSKMEFLVINILQGITKTFFIFDISAIFAYI